jgi:ABC-type Fe3+/spermidine/putrescine transport system ATPase subunit
MSDRIAVMNEGRIEQIGSPAELYGRPRSAFVAGFVGNSNAFAGTALAGAGAGERLSVDIGFTRLAATAAPGAVLRQGEPCKVVVRPEYLVIGGASAENRFSARVTSVMFAGAQCNITVEAAGHRLMLQAAGPSHETHAGRLGGEIVFGCAAEHCLVFPLRDGGTA